MKLRIASPSDLARVVGRELNRRQIKAPRSEVLIKLCQAMYYASLRTEESQAITFNMVYMDPDNPDPSPPQRIVRDRWSCSRLAEKIPVTDSNLVKIAKASDPRTSSFATYSDSKGNLFIWGLIDQQNRYHDYINHDVESGPERPGIFEVCILGPASLVVSKDYEKIAELRINVLTRKAIDVLRGGPVHSALLSGIKRSVAIMQKSVSKKEYSDRSEWDNVFESYWLDALSRLLLRIKNLGHGGAILITPDTRLQYLNVKYSIMYSRFRTSLEGRAASLVKKTYASDRIMELLDKDCDIPIGLYLDEVVNANEVEESNSEIDGTLWYIALLSRIDGLIALTPTFDVRGFGVEITAPEEPSAIYMASNRWASPSRLRELDYRHFGTRHRSMMRYCSQIAGSVGFVVSQDGDVRAMMRVREGLVVWDNIQLQYSTFVNRSKHNK